MDNTSASLRLSDTRTTLLCSGACLSGVLFSAALGCVDRFGELFGFGAAIAVLAGSGVVSVFLIPIVYYLLNRFKPTLWGRYHLPLVITALAAALTCALAFGVDSSKSTASKIVSVGICLPLTEVGLATISYICYSVNVRLLGEERCGFKRRAIMCGVGFLLGAAVSSLPLFGLDFTSVGYGLGCLILSVCGVFYFSSVGVLPRFRRKLPMTVTLKTIRCGFLKKPSEKGLWLFLSALFAASAVSLVSGFLHSFCSSLGLADYVPLLTVAAMSVSGTFFYALAYKKSLRPKASAVCGAVSCALAVALLPVILLAPVPNYLMSLIIGAVFTIVAALIGMILGSVSASERTLASGAAGGIRFCKRIALIILGLSLGLSLACVVSLAGAYVGRILFLSFAAALSLISGVFAVLAVTRGARSQKEDKA